MIEYNIIVGYLFSFRGAKVVFDEREKAERWLARHVQLNKIVNDSSFQEVRKTNRYIHSMKKETLM